MSPEATNVTWLAPWHPIVGGQPDDSTAKELYSELCDRHMLYGLMARPIAHRQDCDTFLFELLDETGRYAVVHLTYAQHPEINSNWPETSIVNSWTDFLKLMQEDALEWNT